ncbi:hypothetical protein [uncultured phage MedDCM-OCT-S09-C399]|nr:hypothetical protein [uncultured phage MedDCM-OCT-S09-C399]
MSTLKVATIQDTSGNNSSTPNQVAQGRAKAWVNFDGTGTVSIDDSFNVSSITDNSTGNYTINFTNAMSNAEYAVAGSVETTNATSVVVTTFGTSGNSRTTSGVRIAASFSNTIVDAVECSVIVFGD